MSNRPLALFLIAPSLAACDTSGEMPILPRDVTIITTMCARNAGMKEASRALPFLSSQWEWRIQCQDGAAFTVPANYTPTNPKDMT
jgi:hypothetical protein